MGYEVAGGVQPWGLVVIPYDLYAPRGRVAYPGMNAPEVERCQLKNTIIGGIGGAGANKQMRPRRPALGNVEPLQRFHTSNTPPIGLYRLPCVMDYRPADPIADTPVVLEQVFPERLPRCPLAYVGIEVRHDPTRFCNSVTPIA